VLQVAAWFVERLNMILFVFIHVAYTVPVDVTVSTGSY
jgi:hypothetical protein